MCERLGVDPAQGLSTDEAAQRLEVHGWNRLAAGGGKPTWRLVLAQFEDVMVLALVGAALVSIFLGETVDAAAVLVIVAVNAVLGYMQEARAERSLDALRRLAAPVARVRRDSQLRVVAADSVAPGDVLILEAGDRVAADGRLLEVSSLAAEESALTGESRPGSKATAALPVPPTGAELAPGDRHNMVFQGSHIVRGHGVAVVTATGMRTEVGRIAGLILEADEGPTPLQRRLDALGRWLVVACLAIAALVVVVGVLQGEPPYRMFLAGVSLAVAAIPEGLPAIVTMALALGVQRMIARHAIVRHLPAVETLGCATIICSDKTGTLTQNTVAVREVYAAGAAHRVDADHSSGADDPALAACVRVSALCNNATTESGDPTEVALTRWAAAAGADIPVLRAQWPRLGEVPFEAERRRMSVLCAGRQGGRVLVKGALEEVLGRCARVGTRRGAEPLDGAWAARLRREGDRMAAEALRVLALAERGWTGPPPARVDGETLERDLTLVGLVGMWDPPRPEVPAAVRRCQQAGIRVVMITGDHALTAAAIARRVGLQVQADAVVSGAEMAGMDAHGLAQAVERASVFARVSPADKLHIVRALRARSAVVAMTGDGVNDAPALKEADIGVAMGLGGTDVTRESSALVLTDDNFATIVAAVEEGRAIYDNIRKCIRYLLACNTGEVLVMLAGTLAGLPLPLLPLQLLLINLVTDGLPALALGLDPPAPDIMRRAPRDPREGVFAGGLGKRIAWRGLLIGGFALGAFWLVLARGGDTAAARTAATCTLVLSQLLHAFDARAERRTLWEVGVGGNRPLLAATASSLLILLAVLAIPQARALFGFAPLDPAAWAIVGALALAGAVLAGAAEILRRIWVRRAAVLRVGRT